MALSLVYFREGKEISSSVDKFFVASENPLYIGLIVKPSADVWEFLKASSSVNIRLSNDSYMEMDIVYKVEVGQNTIFFIKPGEEYLEAAKKHFLSSDE